MDANAPKPAEQKVAALESELARLEVKHSQTDDRDIRDALQLKIEATKAALESLTAEMAVAEEAEAEPEEEILPATPQQIEEAERIIRLAQVERIRGNKVKALDLMKEASKAAPGSAPVLEALGDDYAERRDFKNATETYARALKADPGNINLERKHANMVFQSKGALSVEEQLRMGLGGGYGQESMASAKMASYFSLIIPGGGQLVMGEYVGGGILLGLWALCIIWLVTMRDSITTLLHPGGGGTGGGMIALLPILMTLALHVVSFMMVRTKVSAAPPKTKIERPKPPVNLPFD